MEECIRFEGVCKAYGGHTVLRDFDLTVYSGEFWTMIGRSGCGKTTALRLINGLLTPDAGRVLVDGKDVGTVPVGFASVEDLEFAVNEANCEAIGLTLPEDLKG